MLRSIITGPRSATHLDTEGVEGVVGAEVADGVDECVKVARRQIATGADWIKVSLFETISILFEVYGMCNRSMQIIVFVHVPLR